MPSHQPGSAPTEKTTTPTTMRGEAPPAASKAAVPPEPTTPAIHDPSIPIPLPPSYQESSSGVVEPTAEDPPPTDDQAAPADDAAAAPVAAAKAAPTTAAEVIEDVREKTREFGAEVAALDAGAIAKTDKQYLYLEEMLMRQLIRLDNVETEGKDEIRAARKMAVKEIQEQINLLERKGGAASSSS